MFIQKFAFSDFIKQDIGAVLASVVTGCQEIGCWLYLELWNALVSTSSEESFLTSGSYCVFMA